MDVDVSKIFSMVLYTMNQLSAPPQGFDLQMNALSQYAQAPPRESLPPNGICHKTSNNKFLDCPALMDDGRAFTDYRSPCYINNVLRIKNGIKSSYDYRQFLQHNATQLMDVIRLYNLKKNGCRACDARPVLCQSLCSVDNHAVSCSPYSSQMGIGDCNVAQPLPPQAYPQQMGVPQAWSSLD